MKCAVYSICKFLLCQFQLLTCWNYISTGVLLSLTLPVLYDKYQNPINDKMSVAYDIARVQYEKIDSLILQKIPFHSKKEKKTE